VKSIEHQLKSVEHQLKSIERKLKSIERKLKSIQSKLNSIESTLKSIDPILFSTRSLKNHFEVQPEVVWGAYTNQDPTLELLPSLSTNHGAISGGSP
jgi:septal ring factor EnvC (AmiA/AmiB activator)